MKALKAKKIYKTMLLTGLLKPNESATTEGIIVYCIGLCEMGSSSLA